MLEVADIFREAGPAYRESFASRMPRSHLRVMRAIESCSTAALGGHVLACDQCHSKQFSYHSCRNRHCPKCQGQQGQRWLDRQQARLLPVPYFLLTFTLPSELRCVARPGMIAVLHTWTRAMLFHPHAHVLVTAGGLSRDGERWLSPRNPRFLVPGYALSVLFRAKVRDALKKAELFAEIPASAWATNKKWVVHVKHAGTGTKVLAYLARFLQHVLPRGFTKVRHYGVYSPTRAADLERARALIDLARREAESIADSPSTSDGAPPITVLQLPVERPCPSCAGGHLRVVETIPRMPSRGPP